MGFFYKTEKPKFSLIEFLGQHDWQVGVAAGLMFLLAMLLCRCLSPGKKVAMDPTLAMDELNLPPIETDVEEEDEEEIVTPRRSARIRNKRLSVTI